MATSFRPPGGAPITAPPLIGALLVALGLSVVVGWLLRIPALTQLLPGLTSMVVNTALCFCALGIGLVLSPSRARPAAALRLALAAAVLAVACLTLAQVAFGVLLQLNLPSLHAWNHDGNLVPGQMSLSTAICFICASLSSMLLVRTAQAGAGPLTHAGRALAAVVFMVGAAAVAGYLLKLELLYSWYAFSRMALHTAVCMVLLSIALWSDWRERLARVEADENRIASLATWTLIAVAALSGVTGFAVLKDQSDISLQQGLRMALQARIEVLTTTLELRSTRASIVTTRPSLLRQLEILHRDPADAAARALVLEVLDSFLPYGFSRIQMLGEHGEVLAEAGASGPAPGLELPLRTDGPGTAVLAWNNGFILRNRNEVRRDGHSLGVLLTEQPLPAIEQALRSASDVGSSAQVELCGLLQGTLWCYPDARDAAPHRPGQSARTGLTAIQQAAQDQAGTGNFRDPSGALTIAAFGPVGRSGLAISLALNSAEFYRPLRQRVMWGIVLAVLVTAAGALLLRQRVRAMAGEVARAERRHKAILESLNSGVVLQDRRRRIVSWNAAAGRILGIGAPGPGAWRWRALREDGSEWPEADQPVSRTLRAGEVVNGTIMGLRKPDGGVVWLDMNTAPMLLEGSGGRGVVVAFDDITARRQIEAALAQSNRLRETILEAAPFCIIATDKAGLIQSVNPAAERMLCYRREELIGKSTPELIHDAAEVAARAAQLTGELGRPVQPGFEVFVASVGEGHGEEREWTYLRKDGSRFPVSLSVTAMRDEGGAISGYLGIAYDISERKRREEYTQYIAHHDFLTGLPNRTLLNDRLELAIERARRSGRQMAVLMIDLDHFKRVNDSLGHHVGDALLSTVAERLKTCVRASDTVARMGGDEFVVLLPDLDGEAVIHRIAAHIVRSVSEPIVIGSHELNVTSSVGVSRFPEDGADLHSLLKNADTAMYQAKAAGRAAYRLFSRDMERAARHRMDLEGRLRKALKADGLAVKFEPQVSLATGEVIGMEALLRWTDPERGPIPPLEFIPLAEESGLIVQLGEWVLRTACAQARALQQRSGRPLRLAVNLSPRQFEQDGLLESLRQILHETAFDPALLELEITEGVLMAHTDEAMKRLKELRAAGVSVAVDDFGTGFSSLSYVARFPISTLKIDKSFVHNLPGGEGDAAIVQAILGLAHSLRLKVVAEGVENHRQLEFLRQRHCDIAQGFLFGKAAAAGEFSTHAHRLEPVESGGLA